MNKDAKKQSYRQALNRQARRLDAWIKRLELADRRFFWMRLGSLLAGGIITFVAFFLAPPAIAWLVLVLSVGAFALVVYFHRRLDQSMKRFQTGRYLVTLQLARMDLAWEILPAPPTESIPGGMEAHPFVLDLNLVGPRSLHQLVDTSISLGGSLCLVDWLVDDTVKIEEVRERQELVRELIRLPGFRRKLRLTGALSIGAGGWWDGGPVVAWMETEPEERSLKKILLILSSLASLNVVLFVLNALAIIPPVWILTFMVYISLYFARYRDFEDLFDRAYTMGKRLDPLRAVLKFLEGYPYREGSRLASLAAPYQQCGESPTVLLKALAGVISAASLKNNMLVWAPVNAVLPWDMIFAQRMNTVRKRLRKCLPVWLETWYKVEALSSLANFAMINPQYTFPSVRASEAALEGPVFKAKALGHPLIPDDRRVCNDFVIDQLGEIVVITGSNMSGKSTFLRTLGINLRLAYAGGPVCAGALDTFMFRVFTSMSLSDSLSNGVSYFYAEVRRLKQLLEALQAEEENPLFFLIDEIFRGTNNRERQIGSRAYVRALLGKNGCGVISTHDLELAHLEEESPRIRNIHLREDVKDGRLSFDYRLRPGPSPTTNALKIMEMEGLPVVEGQ